MAGNIMEKRVDELETEMLELREEFQKFIYLISHDLQAPFRSIIGFSQLILENDRVQMDERGRKHFTMVMQGGKKGQAMIDGLLRYSRVHTQFSAPETVGMGRMVEQAKDALEPVIRDCGAVLKTGDLPTLSVDRKQMQTAWYQLLDNALKYHAADAEPVVEISVERDRNFWRFRVQDNGIGIPKKCHESVFEIFQRLHTEEEYPGIGMGLPLVRRIIRRHGGDIRIAPETDEGTGTTLLFTLPAMRN